MRRGGARLRLAALVKGAELVQPVVALVASVYVALYLSGGDLLNVLLNVLVLEFVAGLMAVVSVVVRPQSVRITREAASPLQRPTKHLGRMQCDPPGPV